MVNPIHNSPSSVPENPISQTANGLSLNTRDLLIQVLRENHLTKQAIVDDALKTTLKQEVQKKIKQKMIE